MTGSQDVIAERAARWVSSYPAQVGGLTGIERARAVMASLYDAGLSGISLDAEYGGQGLTIDDERTFVRLARGHAVPPTIFTIGLRMCGPTILSIGTEEQKQRYIRPLLRGEEIWCQLFSEPGAGSDLASVQTSARPDGDGWLVRGQKVWTSDAQFADFGVLLARTNVDVPKNRGLTLFVVDMHAAGVDVRPMRDMTGNAHFNEVFLDDIGVAAGEVLGEINGGWSAAQVMLSHERSSMGGGAGSSGSRNPTSFAALKSLAVERGILADPLVRDRLIELYLSERGSQLLGERLAQEERAGQPMGARAAVAKLLGADLAMLQADVAAEVAGDVVAHDFDDGDARRRVAACLWAPALSLGGGTNEIMRNVIGDRLLDLPREPQVDKDRLFRDLRAGTQKGAAL